MARVVFTSCDCLASCVVLLTCHSSLQVHHLQENIACLAVCLPCAASAEAPALNSQGAHCVTGGGRSEPGCAIWEGNMQAHAAAATGVPVAAPLLMKLDVLDGSSGNWQNAVATLDQIGDLAVFI